MDSALRNCDHAPLALCMGDAPHANRAHPNDEHFLALPLDFGAAWRTPRRLDFGVDSGVLAKDAEGYWSGS